jgi:hypothetical protein
VKLLSATILALAMTCGLDATAAIASPVAGWTPVAGPPAAQYGATLTALGDGRALLAGGYAIDNSRTFPPPLQPAIKTSFLFNSRPARWQHVADMPDAHAEASAVRLLDGRVLVLGGYSDNAFTTTAKAAVFDPSTDAWREAATMSYPRAAATATLLLDGRVLVTGGVVGPGSAGTVTARAELFDPESGRWMPAASMSTPRRGQVAALLQDGRVIVVGGSDGQKTLASAAIYDPTRNTWTSAPPMMVARYSPSIVGLDDGRVLVVGGDSPNQPASAQGSVGVEPGVVTDTAQVFSEKTLSWLSVQSPPSQSHEGVIGSGGFLMADGSVLILESGNGLAQGFIYQPGIDRWSVTPVLNTYGAYAPSAVSLVGGRLLVVVGDRAAFYDFASPTVGGGHENLLASENTSVTLTVIALLLAALLGVQRLRARLAQAT